MEDEQKKIIPIHPYEDDRVTHEFAELNGRRYRTDSVSFFFSWLLGDGS
jgi:hypothetical protein